MELFESILGVLELSAASKHESYAKSYRAGQIRELKLGVTRHTSASMTSEFAGHTAI